MMNNNALASIAAAGARAYFEGMTVEQAEGLHRMYGVDFEMNDGRLVAVKGVKVVCNMGLEPNGAPILAPAMFPAAL